MPDRQRPRSPRPPPAKPATSTARPHKPSNQARPRPGPSIPPRAASAADSYTADSSTADSVSEEDEVDDGGDETFDDESDAASSGVAAPINQPASTSGKAPPRSHTPGHLATRSISQSVVVAKSSSLGGGSTALPGRVPERSGSQRVGSRRKASEVTIRQRSQTTISPTGTAKTPTSGSFDTSILRAPGEDGKPRPLIPADSSRDGERDSSTSRKQPADSSPHTSSAMSSKSGARYQNAVAAAASRANRAAAAGDYVPFPPLDDPPAHTESEVAVAPASGMYWSRAPVSGVPHTALRAHTTTLVGSNIYVFGGCDSRACFNELYLLDGDTFHWTAPPVAGHIPLPLRAMTCTAVGKKLVIFGGGDGPAYYNDIYVLDTLNFRWSKPRVVGDRTPSKRRAHTACLYKNGIYVFGGGDGVRALNDIWRLDVGDLTKVSWRLVSGPDKASSSALGSSITSSSSMASASSTNMAAPSASSPELRPKARGYHTANMVGGKLVIFGGSDGGECFNDVWVYDVDRHVWRSVEIDEPFRRLSHTATLVGSYLFVVGGHDGEEYSADVLLLNLTTMTWERRRTYGAVPSGRGYHGAVLHDGRVIVIGGFDGSEVFGDVWTLELGVHAYYSQISHFTIDV